MCEKTDINEVYILISELEEQEIDYQNFETVFNNRMDNKYSYYYVCEENGKVIGILGLRIDYQLHHIKKVATIEEFIIKSEYRSKGIGKLLLENAITQAQNNNCEAIELTSRISRERAHNFYIKNGFAKNSFKFKMKL